ncbi:MAG: lactoylglutathione lyase, partial [Frankiaceae bacterium]|nr:lactoylglutathione lyase [Frankiaceae bacterium]
MKPADTVLAFHEALELGDDSAFGYLAEDFIQHAAGPQGRAGFRRTRAALEHDLGHLTATVHRVVAENDLVVVHLTLHGRHIASTMPLLAGADVSARPVEWTFIHIWRVT